MARTFAEENGGRAEAPYSLSGLRCLIHLPLSAREDALVLDLSADTGPWGPAGRNGRST